MNGIRDVHKACAEIDLDQALEQSVVLVGVLDRIESAGSQGHPAVFRWRRVGETRRNMSPRLIASDAVRILQSGSPGAIRVETVCGQRLTTRCRWRLTQRQFASSSIAITAGVQALTARMAERNGTPQCFAAVNKLIAADGDIEPLITGLINVSGLLASVAAGAIGTSPEGLVGGPLEIYGPFDQPLPADTT